VISICHSGIPELVRDGVDGYLGQEKDVKTYPEKQKMAIEKYAQTGNSSRAWMKEEFNLEKNCRKLTNIYKSVIEKVKRIED
jgi:colanic acid/amylovoran biosynthesis glycosyltransferase